MAALRRLMIMRLAARTRRMVASLKQPKRLVMMLFFGGLLTLLVISQSAQDGRGGSFSSPDSVRMISLMITFFMVTTAANAISNGVLSFTPPEVQFFFTAPIGAKALLASHLVGSAFKSISASVIFSLFLRPSGASFLRALATYSLLFMVLVLVGLVLDLALLDVPRKRRKLLARFFSVGCLALVGGTVGLAYLRAGEWSTELLDPLAFPAWPFLTVLSSDIPGDVVAALAMILGVGGLAVVRPLTFQGNLREVAGHTSERVSKQLERMAKGNIGQDAPSTSVGRTLPMLPRWGGAGVHTWRQLSSLSRRRKSYALLIFFAVAVGVGVGITSGKSMPSLMAGAMISVLTMAGPLYVQCDFRSDYDCLAYLRSLPTPPGALAAGQMMASAAIIFALQLVLGGWVFLVIPASQMLPWALAFLALPLINMLQLCVENGTFLVYPFRLDYTKGPPGMTQICRMYALMLLKFLVLGVSLGLALGPAWMLAFWLELPLLGALLGLGVLTFEVVLLTWFVGRLFIRVDPGRDLGD